MGPRVGVCVHGDHCVVARGVGPTSNGTRGSADMTALTQGTSCLAWGMPALVMLLVLMLLLLLLLLVMTIVGTWIIRWWMVVVHNAVLRQNFITLLFSWLNKVKFSLQGMSTAISRPDLLTFLTLLNVHLPTGVNMPFSRVQADVRPQKNFVTNFNGILFGLMYKLTSLSNNLKSIKLLINSCLVLQGSSSYALAT